MNKNDIKVGDELKLAYASQSISEFCRTDQGDKVKVLKVSDAGVLVEYNKNYAFFISPDNLRPLTSPYHNIGTPTEPHIVYVPPASALDTDDTSDQPASPLPNAHYQTPHQPIEAMQANMGTVQFVGHLQGDCIKYACRLGRKGDPLSDAKKLRDFACWLVMALEGKTIDPRKPVVPDDV